MTSPSVSRGLFPSLTDRTCLQVIDGVLIGLMESSREARPLAERIGVGSVPIVVEALGHLVTSQFNVELTCLVQLTPSLATTYAHDD